MDKSACQQAKHQSKKIKTKTVFKKASLLCAIGAAPLLSIMAPLTFAADNDVDARIQQLEKMVMQLQQELQQQKSSLVTTQDLSQTNAKSLKTASTSSTDPDNSYKFGGFIKLTGSASDYSDGGIAKGLGRDIYIPGLIPVAGSSAAEDSTTETNLQAKESRINFESNHILDNGSKVKTFLEMDFLGSFQGDERVSNSYSPRLRHAYFTYDNWLFGQTWSTFQNVGALPESADFLASPEGIIFMRQAQVRYTAGPFQFALENPETTVTDYSTGKRLVNDNDTLPDFVARYNLTGDWGHFSAAALARQLTYEDSTRNIDDSTNALAVSLTGKFNIGRDDFRWNLNSGTGMGRYAGLNLANGAVLDADGDLESIDSTSAEIAYRHFWSDKWRSNIILAAMEIDNDEDLTGNLVTKAVQSAQLNLMYSPTKAMTVGAGLLMANREIESGEDGDMTRLIFTAKYGF